MKPIIIYMSQTFDKVVLKKEEFDEYIHNAYNEGYSDGYSAGQGMKVYYPYYPYTAAPSWTWDYTKITCDTKTAPTAHYATTNTDELTGILNGEASNAKGEY